MKTTFTILAFLLQIAVFSQVKIVALHHTGSATQYFSNEANAEPFQLAYTAAVDGDTIYIPGGTFAPPTSFNKRIVVYGAGHYPIATTVTQVTTLSGSINLTGLATGSYFEGCRITGNISYTNEAINDITFKRNIIEGNVIASTSVGNYSLDNIFTENVIQGYLNLLNLRSIIIANNIIRGSVENLTNASLLNNIFLRFINWCDQYVLYNVNACIINNNIFANSWRHTSCGGNVFNILNTGVNVWNNNLFPFSDPVLGTDPTVNNLYALSMSSVFVNYTSNTAFSYNQDYHLKTEALAFLGTDGGQIGIYGGAASYKEQSVPINPHIQSATIQQNSNNGLLNVNIQVQAQSR